MLDGRHTGTGGGNHIVLGGATPADSPFLRRPDLLASLLAYWHNHPSLSYLFCGMFIGPTSQAPRVDEARNDQLYELEIALAEIERSRRSTASRCRRGWSTARCATSWSTSPATPTAPSSASTSSTRPTRPPGRLGLLELRAFEMPPHARMSIVQQLLLRALVARFWKQPYRQPLVRWGTELHDRFLLPDLRPAGLRRRDRRDDAGRLPASTPSWFAPHFEFRFPKVGELIGARRAPEPAHRARALARDGRGRRGRRHGALRRLLAGAHRGQGHRARSTRGTWSPATACRCRCSPRAGSASSSPACATAPGSRRRRCTRRSASTRR